MIKIVKIITIHKSFLQDALGSYNEFNLTFQTYQETNKTAASRRSISELEKRLDGACISFVLSTAFFLEGFIYDYAARNLGDEFSKKYVDKIDVISKWVLIPKLISGSAIDRSRKSFEMLKKVITLRNNIVHFKSSHVTVTKLQRTVITPFHKKINPKEVINALKDLGKQLIKNDPNDLSLENDFKPLYELK